MFGRVDGLFSITVNNLRALEAVSEYIYSMLKSRYVIQIELFPTMTIYHIFIPMRDDFDEVAKNKITKYLELRGIQLMEDAL